MLSEGQISNNHYYIVISERIKTSRWWIAIDYVAFFERSNKIFLVSKETFSMKNDILSSVKQYKSIVLYASTSILILPSNVKR